MASEPAAAVSEACDRFFSIPELVNIFFEQASIPVLLTCQRVCRSWDERISSSKEFRQSLFLEPVESSAEAESKINPILTSHFSPILAPAPSSYADGGIEEQVARFARGQSSNSTHLALLPWARTGTSLTSTYRRAFSRREASWRDMLVSQPPIRRLDWWHEWVCAADVDVDENTGEWEMVSRGRGGGGGQGAGWGHQDSNNVNVTIGMLWDLVESRITRGCWARVVYFPSGRGIGTGGIDGDDCDQLATRSERDWFREPHSQKRGFTAQMPRVKIQTTQVWAEVPSQTAMKYDLESRQWRATPAGARRSAFAGDGFNALREDCSREWEYGERWTKSEAFRWTELDGESSGGS